MKQYATLFVLGFCISSGLTQLFLEKPEKECVVTAIRINPQSAAADFVGPPMPEHRTYVDPTACQEAGI